MSNKGKTHWKSFFDYTYLGSQDFDNPKENILEIVRFNREDHKVHKGEVKSFLVIYFKGIAKGMIVNKVNSRAIMVATKSAFVEDWVGKKVCLFIKPDVQFGGEITEALRIKSEAPKESKPKTTVKKGEQPWNDCVFGILRGRSWATIEKVYHVPAALKPQIEEEAKAMKKAKQ